MRLKDVHSFLLRNDSGGAYVPPSGARVQAPLRVLKVEEFGVATGGGVWVAAGAGLARTDERGVHELEHGTLAKGMGNDLGSPALLAEDPLEHVGGARCAPMRNRKLQVRDAGVEVVEEARRRARIVALVAGDEIVFEHARDLGTAGLVGSKRCALDRTRPPWALCSAGFGSVEWGGGAVSEAITPRQTPLQQLT